MGSKSTPAAAVVALAALALAAVAAAAVTPPPNIKSAGKIVYCSDITYPPEEAYQGTKAVGSDIDIGTAGGAPQGGQGGFKKTQLGPVNAPPQAEKSEAVLSRGEDTAQRR